MSTKDLVEFGNYMAVKNEAVNDADLANWLQIKIDETNRIINEKIEEQIRYIEMLKTR